MTLNEFREKYEFAPLSLEEFAHGALSIQDALDLREAAKSFLEAQKCFAQALEEHNIIIG